MRPKEWKKSLIFNGQFVIFFVQKMKISHNSKSVAHLLGKVLEDKLELIWRDAALVIFTEHPEAFLKTK